MILVPLFDANRKMLPRGVAIMEGRLCPSHTHILARTLNVLKKAALMHVGLVLRIRTSLDCMLESIRAIGTVQF